MGTLAKFTPEKRDEIQSKEKNRNTSLSPEGQSKGVLKFLSSLIPGFKKRAIDVLQANDEKKSNEKSELFNM